MAGVLLVASVYKNLFVLMSLSLDMIHISDERAIDIVHFVVFLTFISLDTGHKRVPFSNKRPNDLLVFKCFQENISRK